MSNRLGTASQSAERFDEYTPGTASHAKGWVAKRSHAFLEREHRERYLFARSFAKGKRVLDIACGEGYGAAILKRAGAASVIAGDKESGTIDQAKAKYVAAAIDYRVMDAEAIDLPAQSIEFVVSFETIEHLEHPERLLAGIQRSAIVGADILISTPNRRVSNPGTTLEDRPQNPFHIREYTPEEFQDLLGQYFEIVQIYGQGIYTRAYGSLGMKCLRIIKALLVLVPGGNFWLARVHRLGKTAEPTYIVAHCINRRLD